MGLGLGYDFGLGDSFSLRGFLNGTLTGFGNVNTLTELMKKESASKKDRFNAAYTLAVISMQVGNHGSTSMLLDMAEQMLPNRPQVTVRRAQVQILKGDFKAASKLLKKSKKSIKAKKQPQLFVKYQLTLADLEDKIGARAKAIKRLSALMKKFPKN